LAPIEQRIARAVESGFDEEDVRRRIARQITDADRVEAADMVFSNTTTREDLYNKVQEWWKSYNA
jgi:dephospho-CoA kinase